jgi:hypothetical protein
MPRHRPDLSSKAAGGCLNAPNNNGPFVPNRCHTPRLLKAFLMFFTRIRKLLSAFDGSIPASRPAEVQIFEGIGGVRCVHPGTQVELLLCLRLQVQFRVDPAQLKVQ